MRQIRRPGLKRVEVGVVLAGLAVVAGLLAVGVQRVRAAAQRSVCQSNLRQLWFAVSNYEISHRALPPAAQPPADLPPDQRLGWLMVILPYVESTNLYRRSGAWDSEANRSAVVPMLVFTCPTAACVRASADANYFGLTGVGPDAGTLPVAHPRAGAFAYDRRTTLGDLTDGTSLTALAIEGPAVGSWTRAGPATLRAVDPADQPLEGHHGVMLNLLLADGAVRSTRTPLSPEVLAALATIAGKDDLPADW